MITGPAHNGFASGNQGWCYLGGLTYFVPLGFAWRFYILEYMDWLESALSMKNESDGAYGGLNDFGSYWFFGLYE